MDSALKFDESVNKYRSVYFHVLDGMLNNEGGTFENVLLTLKDISKIDLNEINFIEKEELLKKVTKLTKAENIKFLNFCIIPNGYNQHLTTTIIFIKNNKMYLYILNTGLDMNKNGGMAIINGDFIHKLTKGIEICNNIDNYDKFKKGLKIIEDFLHIGLMYDFILKKKYSKISNKKYHFDKFTSHKVFEHFKVIIEGNSKLYSQKIFTLNNITMNIDELLENISKNTIYENDDFLKIIERYYIIASEFINGYNEIDMGSFNISDISQYGMSSLIELKTEKQLNDDFLKKIIIYYNHKDFKLYIYPQESGSCTWFSIYFSILFFFIIHKDHNKYIKFINKINSSFIKHINQIYNNDNFYHALICNNKTNYLYMKKMCSKLIDIKILNNDMLYNQQDFIYENNLILNFETYNQNYIDNNYDKIKNLYESDAIDIIINIRLSLFEKNPFPFFKTAYSICQKKLNFFKNIDSTTIISNLNLFIKKQYTTDIDIDNIIKEYSRQIELLQETYSFNYQLKVPSYLTYFIPIIFYINYITEPNENLNDETLFNYCLVFLRFFIIIDILYTIDSFMRVIDSFNNPEKLTTLYDIAILPLINTNKSFNNINPYNYKEEIDFLQDFYKIFTDIEIKYPFSWSSPFDRKFLQDKYLNTTEHFETIFNNFNNLESFLYENPNYITDNFLIYNIGRINKKQEIKDKLINFYCEKIYYNKIGYTSLFILLYNYPNQKNNLYLKFYNGINEDQFKNIINKILDANTTINDFITNVITNQDLSIDIFDIIPKDDINLEEYHKIKPKNCFFNNLFLDHDLNLLIPKDINPNSNFTIYHVLNDRKNYIQYNCDLIKKLDNKLEIRILKILFNNNEVIKFKSIMFPFKYMIPNTSLNFIYVKNNIYNVAINYFKLELSDSLILGKELELENNIYNFEINSNNQFFLNKFSLNNSSFKNWDSLCCNLQLNSYNILYTNLEDKDADTNGYSCNDKKYSKIFNFDKSTIIKETIDYKLTNFKLLDVKSNVKNLLEFKISNQTKDKTESYKKLLFKISQCTINESNKLEWIDKFNKIKNKLEDKITLFTEFIKNKTLGYLINNNYSLLQSYLLNIKILNLIEKILANINDQDNLCSIIKNYNYLFDTKQTPYTYKFEILFELINGNEILNEQMERYKTIKNSYDKYKTHFLKGGAFRDDDMDDKYLSDIDYLKKNTNSLINVCINETSETTISDLKDCNDKFYPLHHFMMGKGKSAIITPLLSLYFNIIKKQNIYIIVPKHLVKQTKLTLQDYLDIFQIKNIFIKSDDEIKNDFLEIKKENKIIKENTVFLIDEFDSLINSLKSNYNYIDNLNLETNKISIQIKKIIENNKKILISKKEIPYEILLCEIKKEIPYEILLCEIKNDKLVKLAKHIFSIIKQLNNNSLKYNIKWGIDSEKSYAIPYRNKDNPIKDSSFTSCILTIFLTYYYYIIINDNKIDENILSFIKNNTYLINKLSETELKDLSSINDTNKKIIYEDFFKYIENSIKLPLKQYNTSFIDIINIDNIFKIGYSGTININLPLLQAKYKFDKSCIHEDKDESTNIEHAIKNSFIYNFDIKTYLENLHCIDTLIDVCGYFYNCSNYKIASDIHNKLKRNVIFIDEKDEKMVINSSGKLEKLNENIVYEKPFFYYDQAHIVGIDIKQDNYPILHGLCIVDNLSYYSEVAQAMFRLRKLNLGHRISFVLNNFSVSNNSELYCKFRQNENNLIEQQKDYLNLQALKSDIRKNRTNKIFMDRYKEELFYYFQDYELNLDPLKLIFNMDEIKCIKLENYNLTLNKVKNIIFELDFESTQLNIQTQTQTQEQEQEQKQTQTQAQIKIKTTETFEYIIKYFLKYKFKNFDFVLDFKKLLNITKYAFKIDDNLYFLPNIFINNCDSFFYYHNHNAHRDFNELLNYSDMVFVYIHNLQIFILIPTYMISYLYNTYLILDLKFNVLNKNIYLDRCIIAESKLQSEKLIKQNLLVKIISNNFTIDEFNKIRKFDIQINYLYLFILFYRIIIKKNEVFKDQIIELFDSNKDNILQFIKQYLKLSVNHYDLIRKVKKNNTTNRCDDTTEQSIIHKLDTFWQRKYLKYKYKYLKLKKNFT